MVIDDTLEEQIATALPDWIERRPLLRARLRELVVGDAPPDPAPMSMTFEEFVTWADEDTWAEWVNGKAVAMSPPDLRHQDVVAFLTTVLRTFVNHHRLGKVLSAPFLVKLELSGREPDILFVSTAHQDRFTAKYLDGPADLVIEVISPDSVGRDRGDKYLEYESAGIPEYWLIDPRRGTVEFYRLDANGHYQLTSPDDAGRYHALVIPGFWLDVTWLWQDPLPAEIDVMRALGLI